MKLTLRDYQNGAVRDVRAAYANGCRAPLLTLPTGGGKTVIFSYIAERAGAKGNRVLILVHRRELLRQTSRTLDDFGVAHGMIAAGMSMDHHQHVQIASVQTLVRRLERLRWAPDLVVVDEAHHTTAKTTWGQVLAHYPEAKILGVTATPQRLDGQGLGVTAGGLFDRLIVGPTVAELTAAGHLSPAVVFAPRTMVDLSSIHTRAGDFAQNEVAEAMDKPTITGDAVAHYRQHCPGEPAIAFCASVAHAEHVAASFQAAGFNAASIDGGMDSDLRAQHVADLGAGRLQVLTSCEIISEGVDIPVVSAAILLRPTQSLGLYLQQVGRVLRPAPGKTRAVILDHVGNCFRHGLPDDDREWSLAGRDKAARKTDDAAPVRQCSNCFHVHRPAPVCPRCGFQYPVQSREVEEVAGELEQVDVVAIRAQQKDQIKKARTLEEFEAIGRARGYKPGWAWFMFNSKQAAHMAYKTGQRRKA
jgi:superfamily II DNA or RNA helicase